MKEKIKKLKKEIEKFDTLSEKLKAKKKAYEKEVEKLATDVKDQKKVVEDLKGEITPLAEKEYKNTDKKKLYGGVGIKVTNVLTYDEKKALAWAKEKDLFIMLDTNAFEKTAPTLDYDWITKKKLPKVTFPKKIVLEDK